MRSGPGDLIARAIAHAKRREFEAVEQCAKAALDTDPECAEAYNLLGVVLVNTGRVGLSVREFERASALRPDDYGYARNLTNLLCRLNRTDEAMIAAERYQALNLEDANADDLVKLVERARGEQSGHNEVFEEIYRRNAWNAGSGLGSLEQTTRPYRDFLQAFLGMNRVTSVVDLGCGDWQLAKHIDWSGIDYLGLDISETALERARKFEGRNVRFARADALGGPLPQADLLIAKDVLQHWPTRDILRFLPKLAAYKWALLTNSFVQDGPALNSDIRLGDFRPIDLTAAPFGVSGAFIFQFTADELKRTLLIRGGA